MWSLHDSLCSMSHITYHMTLDPWPFYHNLCPITAGLVFLRYKISSSKLVSTVMSYVPWPMSYALCPLSYVLCPKALKIFRSYNISLSFELDPKVILIPINCQIVEKGNIEETKKRVNLLLRYHRRSAELISDNDRTATRSEEYDNFVLTNRDYLKTQLSLCEQAVQKVLR